jgi:hypothetical protein
MSNTLLNPTAILRESLRILHTECQFVKNIDKQHDKETTFGGSKRGSTVQIRLPNQYSVRTGWPINVQETVNQTVTLTVATVRGVDLYFTDAELSQNLDDFSKMVLKPAISRLAAEIDFITYQACYKRVYNSVGTAGTTPSAASTFLGAGQKMSEFLTPTSDRKLIVNPAAEAATVGAQIALFNPSAAISKQYTEGEIGRALGFNWFMSQNVPQHTCGSRATASTLQVNATVAVEGSTTIAVKGLSGATQTMTEGDVFTVSSVYAVNPETKQSTGALQQFVVTSLATGSGSVVSATVSPAMYTSASGGLQTIDAFPAENATVTVIGTASTAYPQNLAFHPEFATFATAKLEMPTDVNFKAQEVMDGISMRILRQYDINSANYPCRIDVLCGSLVQRPSMACRIWG